MVRIGYEQNRGFCADFKRLHKKLFRCQKFEFDFDFLKFRWEHLVTSLFTFSKSAQNLLFFTPKYDNNKKTIFTLRKRFCNFRPQNPQKGIG
jgi:hypothetical protein